VCERNPERGEADTPAITNTTSSPQSDGQLRPKKELAGDDDDRDLERGVRDRVQRDAAK